MRTNSVLYCLVAATALVTLSSPASADEETFIRQCEQALLKRIERPELYKKLDAATFFDKDIKGNNAKYALSSLDCDGNPTSYNPSRDCAHQPDAVTENSGQLSAVIRFYAGASRLKLAVCKVRAPNASLFPLLDRTAPVSITDAP